MLDIILNPFVTILLLLYQLVGQNVVLAIVAFTVLIRLVTYPLTAQQQRSSKAMQVIQPELKRLQEKYKGDREKLTQAQMDLYKKHGFNPLGGCLPLLIQLPILLGLYQAIIQALASNPLQLLDLSGRILLPGLERLVPMQNQFLWMNLALPDPTLILPILVLITTWFQQRMLMPQTTGAGNDQAASMTRSMNTVMPIMFFFFSLSFASGLSIYFVVSNIIGIVQYGLMGKVNLRSLIPSLSRRNEPTEPVELLDTSTPKVTDGDSAPRKTKTKTSKAK